MKKADLEHVIRAAAAITDERLFVVIGSQAILAQHPKAPLDLLQSQEADIYPPARPELADLIDGTIGRDSPFHRTFGYYADGVSPETAKLPEGWQERAFRLHNDATGGATAICPEAHDLAAAKLVAGREKDVEWVSAAVAAGIVRTDLLKQRIATIAEERERVDLALQRASGMTRRIARSRSPD